jgi:metacaspase-1
MGTATVIKKCLLIGINYKNSPSELSGCINDTENLKEFLVKNKYFKESDIILVNDNQTDPTLTPTKANILKQLTNLVTLANSKKKAKIQYFLAYSGHGTYLKDNNNDEVDKYDEAICPVDYNNSGFITDDTIKSTFINKLPANVKLFCMFDSCHSGTVLDLKYNYAVDKKNTYKVYGTEQQTKCDVVMISGCKDNQTSADAYLVDNNTKFYEYQGAMTASFLANYKVGTNYTTLITDMRTWLKKEEYTQIPQLSSGKFIETNSQLLLNSFA